MGWINYSGEPKSDIAFFDIKSFYASVECVERGLNPLTTSLCVMSRADNATGLILASSPMFKKVFGSDNVGRCYDLPFDMKTRKFRWSMAKKLGLEPTVKYSYFIESWARRTLIVPPRMGLYIQRNMEIQEIFQNYTTKEEILPYSIDEGFIDLTTSLPYFVKEPCLSKKEKLDLLSSKIQHDIWAQTGVYSTVGMSNSNPLLAKLALDIEAKHTKSMRANWSYEDVENKVWQIKPMTDFWGIGRRTEKRLNRMGIFTIGDLANTNPDLLKKEFGVMGVQLFFHANGVDESKVIQAYRPQSTGLGNSQVLPKDYVKQRDIELVLSEMAEQVAIRLRKRHCKATVVSIYVGFSRQEGKKSISVQKKIDPTQSSKELMRYVLYLFRKNYSDGAVRNIAVRYDGLVDENYTILSLFDDIEELDKQERLEKAVDSIRDKFGYLSVQKASSLLENSRSVARSRLIGGHSAGGLDGLA